MTFPETETESEHEEGEDTHDEDPANMLLRAGFLRGLAARLQSTEDEDHSFDCIMLKRASRSLTLAAGKKK